MSIPQIPEMEVERLEDLKRLNILDTVKEESFDGITKIASIICDAPVSLISLVDDKRQWFKSKTGWDLCESDRDISFCAHAILNPTEIMEVTDSRMDARFADNPLAGTRFPVIFYAGVPLLSQNKRPLGTLCVIDSKPKKLTPDQRIALLTLAKQVENLFELRSKNETLKRAEKLLQERNTQLKKFAGVMSHDMKMPLANMILTTDLLSAKYGLTMDTEGKGYLSYLKQSSFSLSDYIDNLLIYYQSEGAASYPQEEFELNNLLEEIIDMLNLKEACEIHLPDNNLILRTNKNAVYQILLNLIGNSLKYNDKELPIINILCTQDQAFYYIQVNDNGMGIAAEKQEDIFELFKTANVTDNRGKKGNGIGLSTVRNLVVSLDGIISVASVLGEGSIFDFTIKKTRKQ